MSTKRKLEKAQQRASLQHTQKLAEFVKLFCNFLEKKPKPLDDEVREKFKDLESRWVKYCAANHFNPRASTLFNQEVTHLWRTRYTVPIMTKKETQQ